MPLAMATEPHTLAPVALAERERVLRILRPHADAPAPAGAGPNCRRWA